MGIIIDPVLKLVPTELFREAAPFLGVISIILITFDSGVDTTITQLNDIIRKTAGLTYTTFLLITLVTGLLTPLIYPEFDITKSLHLGTMLGGLSTIAFSGLLDELGKIIPGIGQILVHYYYENAVKTWKNKTNSR